MNTIRLFVKREVTTETFRHFRTQSWSLSGSGLFVMRHLSQDVPLAILCSSDVFRAPVNSLCLLTLISNYFRL